MFFLFCFSFFFSKSPTTLVRSFKCFCFFLKKKKNLYRLETLNVFKCIQKSIRKPFKTSLCPNHRLDKQFVEVSSHQLPADTEALLVLGRMPISSRIHVYTCESF